MVSDVDFKILFVADVVGHPGRDAVKALLPGLKNELRPNLTIVNGENAAGGFGLTAKIAAELKGAGADVITSGNHVFAQKDFVGELPGLDRVLRPANYPVTAALTPAYDLLAKLSEEQTNAEEAPLRFLYVFSDRTQACWNRCTTEGYSSQTCADRCGHN